MRRHRERVRDQSGSALLLVAVFLTAVLGLCALAVDLGMLHAARAEVQHAADAAALAGASAFVEAGGSAAAARERAIDYATRNAILHQPVRPGEVAVRVDPAAQRVRVEIRREAPPGWFSAVVGREAAAIGARATARAVNAPSKTCVKPFAPPDPSAAGGSGAGKDEGYGYGEKMVLKGSGPSGVSHAWVLPTDAGWTGPCAKRGAPHTPPAYQANICNCNNAPVSVSMPRRKVAGSPGGLRTHTARGIESLIAQDPHARWDAAAGRVVGSRFSNWRESPRIIAVPLYDPGAPGHQLQFTRFVWVFLEGSGPGGAVDGRYVGTVRSLQLVN